MQEEKVWAAHEAANRMAADCPSEYKTDAYRNIFSALLIGDSEPARIAPTPALEKFNEVFEGLATVEDQGDSFVVTIGDRSARFAIRVAGELVAIE